MEYINFENLPLALILLLLLLAASFITLIIYYLFKFFPLVRYKLSKKNVVSQGSKPISIIVIIRDDIDFLKNRVERLLNQDYEGDFELVIVDNKSQLDETEELLVILKERYRNLYVTSLPLSSNYQHTKKLAYTIGVKAAKYENMLFVSPDIEISGEKWVRQMAKGFNYSNIVTAYSRVKREKGMVNRVARCRNMMQSLLSMSMAEKGKPYLLNEDVFGFTKNIFEKSNGFAAHTRLNRGENDLLIQSLPNSADRSTSLLTGVISTVEREVAESFEEYYSDESFAEYPRRYYNSDAKLYLAIYNIANLLFWISAIALILSMELQVVIFAAVMSMLKILILFVITFTISLRTKEKTPYLFLIIYDLYAPFETIYIRFLNKFSPRKDLWV